MIKEDSRSLDYDSFSVKGGGVGRLAAKGSLKGLATQDFPKPKC